MTDTTFLESLRKCADPTIDEAYWLHKTLRDGDLIHVDEVLAYVRREYGINVAAMVAAKRIGQALDAIPQGVRSGVCSADLAIDGEQYHKALDRGFCKEDTPND